MTEDDRAFRRAIGIGFLVIVGGGFALTALQMVLKAITGCPA